MMRELPKASGVAVQGEDEISSIGMCIGATLAGARSMTATSGPGLSLYSENIRLAIVDVQRLGPAAEELFRFTGSTHDERAIITKAPVKVAQSNEHLRAKIEGRADEIDLVGLLRVDGELIVPEAFCPGRGHHAILDHPNAALVSQQLDPRRVVLVSDIDCSGLSDQHFATSAFHGLHGGTSFERTRVQQLQFRDDGRPAIDHDSRRQPQAAPRHPRHRRRERRRLRLAPQQLRQTPVGAHRPGEMATDNAKTIRAATPAA